MTVLQEGYKYRLEYLEPIKDYTVDRFDTIQFIYKTPIHPSSEELVTSINGTTNEEVLKVLIHRLNYLQSKNPSRENAIVIIKLEESLMWLNKRTDDRKNRGVEGKQIK